MEGMARLALVEHSVQDIDKFSKILYELLRFLNHILDNPHDYQLRTIKSNILQDFLKLDAFSEYIKYVGFEPKEDNLVYPNAMTLSNLRMALVSIERKITICCGSIDETQIRFNPSLSQLLKKIHIGNILSTTNPLLLKIQDLFNNMLQYEDPNLQAYAREQMPLVTLQNRALDRVREQQKKIKTGEIKEPDLPFDIALLMELMSWFKYKFFTWVDVPECECGGNTVPCGTVTQKRKGEMCRVELYKCESCRAPVSFPRYNRLRTLLSWRRGRCGEWANCFTLLCRSLGYDVRYVYDVTDHVWCEVFDYDSKTWLHCDPCEGALDSPLMYSVGWRKKLSYVIAVSRDDIQDVTWRYTTQHQEVLKRRRECTEQELIDSIIKLRSYRQRQGSAARRLYLAKRTVIELVHLMKERKPEDSESHGRISGSSTWRRQRGECGAELEPYIFCLANKGMYIIQYNCALDRYLVNHNTVFQAPVYGWAKFSRSTRIFKKVEHDWKRTYLAREEGAATGEISWKFSASSGLVCKQLGVSVSTAIYKDGKIAWSVAFDDGTPEMADFEELLKEFDRTFRSVTIRAVLSGGAGPLAWQHAQLFRQSLRAETAAFLVTIHVQ